MPNRDRAADQLKEYAVSQQQQKHVLTTTKGCPVGDRKNIMTVGPRGPVLLQDVVYLEEQAHFDRERIPERVVHAKGAGAFGYFEVTHDITKYCKAKIFSEVGKRTPLAIRFSTVAGESGSADTVRDPRGFAVKFYTEDGNWDLVGNNTPIFFIRDAILFPSFIHTQKRNPVTHLKDIDMFWDFMTLRTETVHQLCFLFSDRGIPDGYRHMNGYSSHTYKMINDKCEAIYVKFHHKTDQGIKNIPPETAAQLSGSDPDYAIRDLYNAIAEGNYPSWTTYIQVMTFKEAENFRWNPFDLTKIWPQSEYPLIPVGKIVLNQNPKNYFTDVEQMAFSPASLVPGIEPSPDKMLQGRLFAYDDTHRHRLGTNFMQIPVNCPYRARPSNYTRDGPQCVSANQAGAPNYFPNSFSGPVEDSKCLESCFSCSGDVARYNSGDDDNFSQSNAFWNKVLKKDEKEHLVENIVNNLKNAQQFLQERAVKMFTQVDPEFGQKVNNGLVRYRVGSVKFHGNL